MHIVIEVPDKTPEQSALIATVVESVLEQLGIDYTFAEHPGDLSTVTYVDVQYPVIMSGETHDVKLLSTTVLNAPVRLRKMFLRQGFETLGDIIKWRRSELMECKNIGETSLNMLERGLKLFGLALKEE